MRRVIQHSVRTVQDAHRMSQHSIKTIQDSFLATQGSVRTTSDYVRTNQIQSDRLRLWKDRS
jgi:hypothetical protein